MRDLALIMGDMLFPDLTALPADAPIWMSEDWGLCTRVRHHRHKVTLFLSAMRHRAAELVRSGRTVHYTRIEAGQPDFFDRLGDFMRDHHVERLHTFEPHDAFARVALDRKCRELGVELVFADSPGFLTSRVDWENYRSRAKRLFMADFYRYQRRRLGILVAGDAPVGGQWSFDEENRKPLPKALQPPPFFSAEPDTVTREVIEWVDGELTEHVGRAADFGWPVTRQDALRALESFLIDRFDQFGPYEDAISKDHRVLFHSLLSPLLNCGLLTPREVVDRALRHAKEHGVGLASLEGFVRQIVGWREFIRGVDRVYRAEHSGGSSAVSLNHLGHHRRLKPCWWDGTTGLLPLDTTIKRVLEHGYCHHIERLMVLGSAMQMCEVHPDEAYRWFMELFVDSADWVMAPNVYGMSQFADGGLFATKPYVSGSAYLRRMSDYPDGPWCEVWDGLYWRFVHRHQAMLSGNPRMTLIVKAYARLDVERRGRLHAAADRVIEELTLAGG